MISRLQLAGGASALLLYSLMMFALKIPTQDTIRHIHRIQAVTIVWMMVEAAISKLH